MATLGLFHKKLNLVCVSKSVCGAASKWTDKDTFVKHAKIFADENIIYHYYSIHCFFKPENILWLFASWEAKFFTDFPSDGVEGG